MGTRVGCGVGKAGREWKATLVEASRSALANELRVAPALAALDTHIIGHGLDAWPKNTKAMSVPTQRGRLRLVVVRGFVVG